MILRLYNRICKLCKYIVLSDACLGLDDLVTQP